MIYAEFLIFVVENDAAVDGGAAAGAAVAVVLPLAAALNAALVSVAADFVGCLVSSFAKAASNATLQSADMPFNLEVDFDFDFDFSLFSFSLIFVFVLSFLELAVD